MGCGNGYGRESKRVSNTFIYIIFRMRYEPHEYISITIILIIIIIIIIIINFKQTVKDSQVLQTKVPMLILLLQQETKQN